jgi:hypothetical protein
MKPRRTVSSTGVLALPGGNEDSDLWYESCQSSSGAHIFETVWVPTVEERQAIADGANVALLVWGRQHPPVSMAVTHVELGRGRAS